MIGNHWPKRFSTLYVKVRCNWKVLTFYCMKTIYLDHACSLSTHFSHHLDASPALQLHCLLAVRTLCLPFHYVYFMKADFGHLPYLLWTRVELVWTVFVQYCLVDGLFFAKCFCSFIMYTSITQASVALHKMFVRGDAKHCINAPEPLSSYKPWLSGNVLDSGQCGQTLAALHTRSVEGNIRHLIEGQTHQSCPKAYLSKTNLKIVSMRQCTCHNTPIGGWERRLTSP